MENPPAVKHIFAHIYHQEKNLKTILSMEACATVKSELGGFTGDTSSLQNPWEEKKKSLNNEISPLHFALEHLIINHTPLITGSLISLPSTIPCLSGE